MAHFRRKATHRLHKGCCYMCGCQKRCGNHKERTKAKYFLGEKELAV